MVKALTDQEKAVAEDRVSIEASFRGFFAMHKPNKPYFIGPHTRAIMKLLQRATETVERGGRCYEILNCPPRHGKSDLVSRRYPVWHLLRNPDHNVILATYGQALANDMSRSARRCARRCLRLSADSQQIAAWELEGGGCFYAVGLGSAVTGRGANVLVIDDYLKGIQDAQSVRIRDKVWEGFRSELYPRLSPEGHAVIITATRWHEDDLVGRVLEEAQGSKHFPDFNQHIFPAWDSAEEQWLFEQRFAAGHYRQMRSAVGAHWWQALYQQNPQPREGNLLKVDNVQITPSSEIPDIPMTRGWDLASTEAERTGHDPDYTVGTKAGYDDDGNLWVADVIRGRWAAPQRDKQIRSAALQDGPAVRAKIESVAAQRDTTERMRISLGGGRTVQADYPTRDKVARTSVLEPLFENRKIYLARAEWNDAWLSEFRAFPGSRHDDQVDSLVIAEKDRRKGGADMELW